MHKDPKKQQVNQEQDTQGQNDQLVALTKPENFLFDNFHSMKEVKDQEIVLIIGDTGSGKTTLVDYLLGYQFDSTKHGVVRRDSAHTPNVQNQADSDTVVPTCYPSPKDGLTYCDCPGFHENRKSLVWLVEILRELVVRMAKNMKAVVLVVEYHSFITKRGENFRTLIKFLTHYFIRYNSLFESIIFVISKTPDHIVDVMDIKELLLAQYNKMYNDLNDEDNSENGVEDMVQFMGLLLEKGRIFISKVTDDGNSRRELIAQIMQINSVRKSLFKMNRSGADKMSPRNLFDTAFRELIQRFEPFLVTLQKLNDMISEAEKTIEKEQNAKCSLEVAITKKEQDENNIQYIKTLKSDLEKELKELKGEVEKIKNRSEDKINKFQSLMAEIDTDELIPYYEDEVIDTRFMILGQVVSVLNRTTKTFSYKGVPFDKCDQETSPPESINETIFSGLPPKGELAIKENDKKKGIFHGVYQSARGCHGYCSVKIYGVAKNLPHNATTIKDLNEKIASEKRALQEQLDLYEPQIHEKELYLSGLNDSLHLEDLKAKVKNIEATITQTKETLSGFQEDHKKWIIRLEPFKYHFETLIQIINCLYRPYSGYVKEKEFFDMYNSIFPKEGSSTQTSQDDPNQTTAIVQNQLEKQLLDIQKRIEGHKKIIEDTTLLLRDDETSLEEIKKQIEDQKVLKVLENIGKVFLNFSAGIISKVKEMIPREYDFDIETAEFLPLSTALKLLISDHNELEGILSLFSNEEDPINVCKKVCEVLDVQIHLIEITLEPDIKEKLITPDSVEEKPILQDDYYDIDAHILIFMKGYLPLISKEVD